MSTKEEKDIVVTKSDEKGKEVEKIEELSMESLFKAGAYFGHKKSRRNPKMDEFVFMYREGVAIIDLKKTLHQLQDALRFIEETASSGKMILFSGTKKHIQSLVKEKASEVEMPFVNARWLGGTFTNFDAIRSRVRYLIDLEEKLARNDFASYTKLERLKKQEEVEKMNEKLGGLRTMTETPGVLFVTDVKEDSLAIKEAKIARIPVVAIVDTNDDPAGVSCIVPANNDAISSVRFILNQVVKAIKAGKARRTKSPESSKNIQNTNKK
ncbi:MAG: 30S ribosomal protein S2 [Candidatus Moraniibacteriota bacterium]|nr:MAG: 30S ribosomal protein S2 [Candidatus Moranbacteria bacterium]